MIFFNILEMIKITKHILIDEEEVHFDFIRASGAGGQNVNKVATAVQLRFDLLSSSLPEEVKKRLIKIIGKRLTKNGELVIEAKRFRTQHQNRDDAVNRLAKLIDKACQKPKIHLKTQPPKVAKEKRLLGKKKHGEKKKLRQKPKIGLD